MVGRECNTVTREDGVWKDPVEVYNTDLSGFNELIFALGSSISTFGSRWTPPTLFSTPAVLAFPPLTEVIYIYGNSNNPPQKKIPSRISLERPIK